MERILVLDFGAQYAHLISRRIRELSVYSELIPFDSTTSEIMAKNPKGLILSGGPNSIYDSTSPVPDPEIFNLNIPILGICYGLQVITHLHGGKVTNVDNKEYGKALLEITNRDSLFKDIKTPTSVWMSHGDAPNDLPKDFGIIGKTNNSEFAAIQNSKNVFGIQFHPEVHHTIEGKQILKNFVYDICECNSNWKMESFIENSIENLKSTIGNEKVICGLSGGVDSSVVSALLNKAIGKNLQCVLVDHGLLRKNESDDVINVFKDINVDIHLEHSEDEFLNAIDGIEDPEQKRIIIGNKFIDVFTEVSNKKGPYKFLAQGTLYPDIIESAKSTGPAVTIKTHHNVGGLPEKLGFELVEPLRDLYKDEVRIIGKLLGLPNSILKRHPFPGPGLAVRIIGVVNKEKLEICRDASYIVEDELIKAGLYDDVWQAFAFIGDDKVVGVQGDQRSLGYIVTIKIIDSVDAMTADWVKVPYDILDVISRRITNEIKSVTLVNFSITSKPPSTIEPQ